MSRNFFGFSLTVFLLLNFSLTFAQDYAESALMFSRTKPGGSARIQGMGGSQVALGGDYSSALSNPAGLGMYNRSEFTITPALSVYNTPSTYLGQDEKGSRTVFNIPGLSLVWHLPKENGAFLGGSFAVSLSRTNDFNRKTYFAGNNTDNSIIDYFIADAQGHTTYQFDDPQDRKFNRDSLYFNKFNDPTGLAYFNYLIGPRSIEHPDNSKIDYFTDADYPYQETEVLRKGATNQWSISYGANISDRFFFGGGIGISSLRYKTQTTSKETFELGPLEYMELVETFDVRGSGFNANVGIIARPLDFLQIGASYITPTYYTFTETYKASMGTNWDNWDYYGDGSKILRDNTNDPIATDLVTSDYSLTIPSKFNAGVAFISKFGLITGDIELTNPAKTRYSAETSGISYKPENDDIKYLYQSVVNYRVGAEYRYEKYRFRAGYGVLANSYRGELDIDNTVTTISGGAGYRADSWYIDFALVRSTSADYYFQPYTFPDGSGPVAKLQNRTTTGMITLGFTF